MKAMMPNDKGAAVTAARLEQQLGQITSQEEGVLLLSQAAALWQMAREQLTGVTPDWAYYEAREAFCRHESTRQVVLGRLARTQACAYADADT